MICGLVEEVYVEKRRTGREFRPHDAIRNATPMLVFCAFPSLFFLGVALLLPSFLELRDALFLYRSSCQYTWTRVLCFREYDLLRMTH